MTDRSGGPWYPENWTTYLPCAPEDSPVVEDARSRGFYSEGVSARLKIAVELAAAYENAVRPYTVGDVFDQAEELIAQEAERVTRDAKPDVGGEGAR